MALSHVRIHSPKGHSIGSLVEVDGVDLTRSLTSVTWKLGVQGMARLTLEMYSDIEIEGEAVIVKKWRKAKQQRDARSKVVA